MKSSQANQTELAHNFTEAAGFKVYTKLHITYWEQKREKKLNSLMFKLFNQNQAAELSEWDLMDLGELHVLSHIICSDL